VVEGAELALRLAKSRLYGQEPYFRCTRISVVDEQGLPANSFRSDEEITVIVDYDVIRPVPSFRLLVTLTSADQATILRTETLDDPQLEAAPRLKPGVYRSQVTLPRDLLGDARLALNVSLISEVNQVLDYASVVELDVRFAGHGSNTRGRAYLRPALEWRTEAVQSQAAASLS
jgi:hypothetical protein